MDKDFMGREELHVVALSGGKDSTAMALRLKEVFPKRNFTYILTPTGDELPEMFEHWKKLSQVLEAPLVPVMGGTLKGLIYKYNALPNWRQRFCTRQLKIQPYAAWLMEKSKTHNIYTYIGLRADEEEREGGDYEKVPGVMMLYPLREWGWNLEKVLAYLNEKNIVIPDRTDCARCFFQTTYEWWKLWKFYPDIFNEAMQDEERTGHTYRSPTNGSNWPAELKLLKRQFENGLIPPTKKEKISDMKCRVCRL